MPTSPNARRRDVIFHHKSRRQTVDGADNARLGFQFMQHAQKNPEMMQDVMKDLQDPETMEKVQEMMQVGLIFSSAFFVAGLQLEWSRFDVRLLFFAVLSLVFCLQDPNFRAEVERMKAQMMQNPEMQVCYGGR